MFKGESTEIGLNYKSNLGKSTAFRKAAAKLTILSVLSNKVKSQSALLRNRERTKQEEILGTKLQATQTVITKVQLGVRGAKLQDTQSVITEAKRGGILETNLEVQGTQTVITDDKQGGVLGTKLQDTQSVITKVQQGGVLGTKLQDTQTVITDDKQRGVLGTKLQDTQSVITKVQKGGVLETNLGIQQDTQNGETRDNTMTSTRGKSVKPGGDEVVKGDVTDHGNPAGMVNGTSDINGNKKPSAQNGQVASKNSANSSMKHGKNFKKGKTPFDFMNERELSEPVLSSRKRANAMSSSAKMTRCRSTVDLLANENPVVRELGGYKFYQRPGEVATASKNTSRKTNSLYRAHSEGHPKAAEMTSLRKTIEEQKETIASREKYVLQLEKKISTLENETTNGKKQIASLHEKVDDCASALDFLRHEKDALASEKDSLNGTLLSYEDELVELRTANVKLVTEYEHSEQSRKIAVGHLHEIEKPPEHACDDDCAKFKISQKPNVKNSPKFLEQLNSVKDCVQKLRDDREALESEQKGLSMFFEENVRVFLDRVSMELEKGQRGLIRNKECGVEQDAQEEDAVEKGTKENGEKANSAKTSKETEEGEKGNGEKEDDCAETSKKESEDGETDGEMNLVEFKGKLKSNEDTIDQLANNIRDLENKKKGLLESRYAMIQGFQARQEFMEEDIVEENEEEDEHEERDVSENEEEFDENAGNRKQSYRVTRKIRKLERTLSMNHGVGKIDCIQTLCKKLEDCEQKVQELETANKDLREENDDMEEEAKYLKYVLAYRGDTMKAQLEQEFRAKLAAATEELRVAKETLGDAPQHHELTERNRALEDEVQRLHEELKSLLLSLPALQGAGQRSADADTSSKIGGDRDEAVRSLEEKVRELSEEKHVLWLSMQTLSAQGEAGDRGNDTSFSQSLLVMEKTLREVENENTCFLETFQRIREVLEVDDDDDEHHVDSFKISKLKGEIQRLRDTRRSTGEERGAEVVTSSGTCVRHEERLSELGQEVVRLHEEKKSLLSTIIRLQADPNFTFSDDVTTDYATTTDEEMSGRSSLASPGGELLPGDDDVDGLIGSPHRAMITTSSPFPLRRRTYRDQGVQVGPCDDFGGLLGYLEQDLARLKTALSLQGIMGAKVNREPTTTTVSRHATHEPDIPADIQELRRKVEEFEEQNRVLQENLGESEAIRSDLHRTISIATDMATEERSKCTDLMKSKTALEKDMITLTKDNQDLRDGLETLSRVRKRRNSRVQYMSHASPACDGPAELDGSALYLPLIKPRCSESELSDMDSSIDAVTPDSKC